MIIADPSPALAPLLTTSGAVVGATIAGTVALLVARQNNRHARREEELRRRHALAQSMRQERQALYVRFFAAHAALTRCMYADSGNGLGEQAELLFTLAEEIFLVGSDETAEQAKKLVSFYFSRLADADPTRSADTAGQITREAESMMSALARSMKKDLSVRTGSIEV